MLDELERDFDAETGFGTGLRAHLRAQYDPVDEPEAPPPPPAAAAEAEPDPEETALDAMLEPLVLFEAELNERAQSLAIREQALKAEAKRIAEERAELEQHLDVRELLRARAELEAERLWRTFDEALEATGANGAPDYRTRLDAARALLAEAYAPNAEPTAADPAVPDELAVLRERKVLHHTQS
jgi:hypothetical protein